MEQVDYLNNLSGQILDAAIEVHRELGGPGLLESIYEEAFAEELLLRGLKVERQIAVPVYYKGKNIKAPCYVDLLVAGEIVVEIKSVERIIPIYSAQLLTYLRLSGKKLGLVVNFGERYVKSGFQRVVNGL